MSTSYSESQIGPYLLDREIGRGGMGVVYRARHQGTGQLVALKTLLRPGHDVHAKALLDEAITGRKLDHPNCLKSYGVLVYGPAQNPAIVSEYIEGMNLRDFLDSLKLEGNGFQFSALDATLILEQLFLGLRAAHKAGLIHQDIKPENYLISQTAVEKLTSAIRGAQGELTERLFELRDSGWLKLSDWGLSILKERERSNNSQSLTFSLSQIPEGKRGGTLVYMSLEQIDGVGVSRRTDIFALSLIYYELLTGCSPINARSTAEGLGPHCFDDLQVYLIQMISSSAQSAIDPKKDANLRHLKHYPRIQELILSMSMRQKADRLGSAELEDELEDLINQLDEEESESAATNWALYLSFLTFLLPVALWYFFTQGDAPKMSVQESYPSQVSENQDSRKTSNLTLRFNKPGPKAPNPKPSGPPDKTTASKNSELKPASSQLVKYNSDDLDRLRQGDLFTAQKLKHIDKTLGQILGTWPQPILLLDGVESISTEGAKGLANYSGGLLLRKLKTISTQSMAELAQSTCFALSVGFQESLAPSAIEALARYKGQSLTFSYQQPLSQENVTALAKYEGQELILLAPIKINSLTAATIALSKAKSLTLHGTTSLDGQTALALSQYSGFKLAFTQLPMLNWQATRALGGSKAKQLAFPRLETLSPEAAINLSQFKGEQISLGVLSLNQESAVELMKFQGKKLEFSRLKVISKPLAKIFATCQPDSLSIQNLESMDEQATKELARFGGGQLSLNTRFKLGDGHARALSLFTGPELILSSKQAIEKSFLKAIISYPGQLTLKKGLGPKYQSARLRYLRTRPAWERVLTDALSRDRSRTLSTMTKMTREVAFQLQTAPEKTLNFLSLTELDFIQARHLARAKAQSLHFPKLRSLDKETRGELLKFKGLITINGQKISRSKSRDER